MADLAEAARVTNALLASGRLTGRIGRLYPHAEARRAHEDLERHTVRGRLLVTPEAGPTCSG